MRSFLIAVFSFVSFLSFGQTREIAITIDDLPFVASKMDTPGNQQRAIERFDRLVQFLVDNQVPATGFIIAGAIGKGQWAFLEKFKIVKKKHNFEIIDYIFYSENQIINNNEIIAENFFNLLQMTNTSQIINNKSIDYYLFYLNLSLNFKPNYIEALFIKGQIYKELKFFLKAEKIFKKIEPHQSLYLEAQKNIILIKKEIYEFTKAEQILFNLIDKYPQDNSLLILLADMYRLEKKYEKSIQYYTLIINKKINNDNEWRLYFLRAICNERLNKWKKAERDLLKALEINPDQPQVLNYLAYGWIEKNYYIDKSINMLEIAVQKNPKSHYILDSLGWAYYKNNDLSKALQIMEKVIEMAPGEAISLDHLGDIYFSLGREKEAYFMWKQALDLAEPEDDISESVKNKIDKYNAG